MYAFAERLKARSRKGWLRTRPLFQRYAPVALADLVGIESEISTGLPNDLREWLLEVGYGDINENLSFRQEWFRPVEQGHLRGAIVFAQDGLGNFYAFSPADESIIFFSRSAPEYAILAPSFRSFVEQLERRDFKLNQWTDALAMSPYSWTA